ncbi:MAG: DUF4956 domain-containing protein [Prolixibacteraceae bacterium]|nr:DUF4956 domain-containing protein [Prolixibacteraceae bacterium]MBN2774939.1 DUF4956 domain-containing protein [Prolixibacteraceae bacterium]
MSYLNYIITAIPNIEKFTELGIRFGFNLVATFIVVVLLYARNSRRKNFFFSYFAISVAIFLLCYLLASVELGLGFALGLFAIFGIIRYRTDPIPIKEMTYLFVIIAISVINALSRNQIGYLELSFVNILLVGALWALEKILMLKQESSLIVTYEKIENIHKNKEKELLEDLKERTGIIIKRYEIEKVDFLRDVAIIKIYFDLNGSGSTKRQAGNE